MLAMLRTRPPVDEEGEQVGRADGAVAVEVRLSVTIMSAGLRTRDRRVGEVVLELIKSSSARGPHPAGGESRSSPRVCWLPRAERLRGIGRLDLLFYALVDQGCPSWHASSVVTSEDPSESRTSVTRYDP